MLTLIPEQERSIDYRFEFAIVGTGAKDFAETAVNSEMAEAFRPTAKHQELHEIHEGDEEPNSAHGHGHAEKKVDDHHVDGIGHKKGTDADQKNKLVLFCPIGEGTKALARVRFTCIEHFSDSLPLGRDAQLAMNQAVIFLYYPNAGEGDRSADKSPVDEFKHDFISRWAEINHTPEQFRPHVRILAIEAAPEAEEALAEFGKTKNVPLDSQPDYAEDCAMESLQSICDKLIERRNSTERTGTSKTDDATAPLKGPGTSTKSSCCVLL